MSGTAVLDASALLAFLLEEPGAERVIEPLARSAVINAVNWTEVLSKMSDLGGDVEDVARHLSSMGIMGRALRIEPFDETLARQAARMRPLTRELGLSLGDRACLALGHSLGLPVLTTDRTWQSLRIGVKVRCIR